MRHNLFLFFFVLVAEYSFSQVNFIKGRLLNLAGKPIPYATVILTSDIREIKTQTDDEGVFRLEVVGVKKNLRILFFDQVLYEKDLTGIEGFDFGDIKVNETLKSEEVIVIGDKPAFEVKPDRVSFDIKKMTIAVGGGTLEVLEKLPGIIIDNDNNINILGKGAAMIMVNGKIIRLPKNQLNDFVKSLNVKMVSRVEVIHHPPAKYAAEGQAGIINIITEKPIDINYFDANYKVSYTRYILHNASFNYNYNKGKIKTLVTLNGDYGNVFKDDSFVVTNPDNSGTDQSFFLKKGSKSINGAFIADWYISSSTFLGLNYTGNFSFPTNVSITNLSPFDSSVLDNILTNNVFKLNKSTNLLSINFNKKIRNTNVDIGGDFLNFANHIRNKFDITVSNSEKEFYEQYTGQDVNNYSLSLDLVTKIDSTSLGYGGKVLRNITNNSVDFYDKSSSGLLVKDSSRSDNFSYNENIQALYFSFKQSFSEKLNLTAGLRLEHTQTAGKSITSSKNVNRDYTNFLPSISIMYLASKEDVITINYTQRINRPSFSDTNPFKVYISKNSYARGNPFLNPSYSSNLELQWKHKNITLSTYFIWKKDVFGQIFTSSSKTVGVIFNRENFYKSQNYGVSLIWNLKPYPFWISLTNIRVFGYNYSIYDNVITSDRLNKGFAYYFYNRNVFNIDSTGVIRLEISLYYTSPQTVGFYDGSETYNISSGINYTPNKSFSISLNANDILAKSYPRVKSSIGDTQQDITLRGYKSQRISLSINYTPLLKKKTIMKARNNNKTQINRLN